MIRRVPHAHRDAVRNIKYNTELLFTNSADMTIKIWDIRRLHNINDAQEDRLVQPLKVLTVHNVSVNAIDFAGVTLVGACADRTIKVWSISQGILLRRVEK